MPAVIKPVAILIALLSVLLAFSVVDTSVTDKYVPQALRNIPRTLRVLGVFRTPANTVVADPADFVVIDDTTHCEDLHHHEASNLLFTACEGSQETRYAWFPPLAIRKDPGATTTARGSLHVIDPKTMKAEKLELDNFHGPFVTHGIDVISDPEREGGQAVYIFAINHVPDAVVYGKTHSQVEIFHYEIGSRSARHIRSVWDPAMTTPNDILALSPTSFFATNDHHYATGWKRKVEDVHFGAKWTGTIHFQLAHLRPVASAQEGLKATVALEHMHNNNGLGHGRSHDEVLVVECVSGILNIGHVEAATTNGPTIKVDHRVSFDSTIDNPSFFIDPFGNKTYDGSSYLAPGLTRAVDTHSSVDVPSPSDSKLIPVMVWRTKMVTPPGDSTGQARWETELLFEDDGSRINSASAAVQVAIDPAEEGGRRRAWLFVTGFVSQNIIAVKVDV